MGGSDPALDEAIGLHDGMANFLQQDMFVAATLSGSVDGMMAAMGREAVFP